MDTIRPKPLAAKHLINQDPNLKPVSHTTDSVTDQSVKEWIDRFVAAVVEKYSPEKILLFGSRARGDNLVDSDVDIIVVSKKFEGVNWLKRIRDLSVLWDGMVRLDLICYTPAEFEEKKGMIGIVGEAAREGKDLYVT